MVDKLALVSKVLLDQRFLELKQENEQLKLKLFWKEYNTFRLVKLISLANRYGGPNCPCALCTRHPHVEVPCTFTPWFEEKLLACGLTFAPYGVSGQQHDAGLVYNVDHHLLYINIEFSVWVAPTYGTKLWKATSVSDPELQKLVALFRMLEADE